MAFEFRCSSCSEMHRGMPNFGADAPLSYYEIPAEQRDARCRLGSDDCVIDEAWYFVRGCSELPVGPFFGWLNAWLKPYPETMNLKTRVHLRDHGVRPSIELEPTEHPLAVEQRAGISVARVSEIYAQMVHEKAV